MQFTNRGNKLSKSAVEQALHEKTAKDCKCITLGVNSPPWWLIHYLHWPTPTQTTTFTITLALIKKSIFLPLSPRSLPRGKNSTLIAE